jgi:hypothetical protein
MGTRPLFSGALYCVFADQLDGINLGEGRKLHQLRRRHGFGAGLPTVPLLWRHLESVRNLGVRQAARSEL